MFFRVFQLWFKKASPWDAKKEVGFKRCTSRMKAGKSRIMWASWENSPQSHPRFLSCSIAHISKFLLNSLLTLPLLRIAHQVTLQLCNKMPPDACNSVWRSIWEFTGALIVVGENSWKNIRICLAMFRLWQCSDSDCVGGGVQREQWELPLIYTWAGTSSL